MKLQFLMVMAILAASCRAQDFPMALPGCKDKCGNISIPYPFGMSDVCFYDPQFLITCNETYDPPKAFLTASNINVTSITLDGKVHILQFIANDCYNESGPTYNNQPSLFLTKFIISDIDNVFVGIGCDTEAVVSGFQRDSSNAYEVGCISKCENMKYVDNNTCSGIGCCKTSLAKGVSNITISISSYFNHSGILDFNPCSYAFIVEEKTFTFSAQDLMTLQDVDRMPMVVEWTIGKDNCSTAKEDMMYNACQAKYSSCYDPENGPGYRCKCLHGYEGNPYLPYGCQDIDECKNPRMNDCDRTCINTQGSYYCVCPKGFHGDGRRGGQGCVAGKSFLIVTGFSTGLGIPLLVAIFWWFHKKFKRMKEKKLKEQFFKRNGGLLLEQEVFAGDGVGKATKLFTSKDLERATDSYNENRILGRGGQGTVYKGMLEDGRIVAIKKSKLIDESQLREFINEVVVLQQVNHRNVVKLLGCCLETEVPMLVYEFIPNGMLSQYLHDPNEEFPMSWNIRLQISAEVADALSYLHSAASNPIYHCDIKSANILLDEKYKAKIADFGISKSIDLDQTHLTIPKVQGTFGYLDPEYFRSSQFTDKSDVYSFGVVLVELLTGEKPISFARSENERSLINHFLIAMEENRLLEIVDSRIKEGPEEAIMAFAKLARKCLNMMGKNRPTMKEIASELQGIKGSKGEFISTQNHKDEEPGYGSTVNWKWEEASTSTMSFVNRGPTASPTSSSNVVEPLISCSS